MNMPQIGKALAVAALATFAASNAFAAQDGLLGANSQGSLNIILSIDPLVQISRLNDIALGTFDGTAKSGADDLCVYSNTGGYHITATGNGSGSAFELIGTSGATIPYAVEWADSTGASAGIDLIASTALTGQGGNFTTPDCGGADNAGVIVTISSTDLALAPADSYIGVLTLLVAPE
jgi:hypothetical protein